MAQQIIDNMIGPITISVGSCSSNLRLFDRIERDVHFRARIHHVHVSECFPSDMSPFYPDTVPYMPPGDCPYRPGGYFSDDYDSVGRLRQDATWPQLARFADMVGRMQLASIK